MCMFTVYYTSITAYTLTVYYTFITAYTLNVYNTYITAYTLNVSTLSVLPVAAANFESKQHIVCSGYHDSKRKKKY